MIHGLKTAVRQALCFSNFLEIRRQRARKERTRRLRQRRTGLSFECHAGAEDMALEVLHHRLYDIPEAPVRSGDSVVDIGANHGFASCHFAQRGAEVLAFEPNPRILPYLRRNILANRLGHRVLVREEAVLDHLGMLTLEHSEECGGGIGSVIAGFVEGAGGSVTARFEVKVTPLDDALRSAGWDQAIRLIKLDAEGSEERILRSLPEDLVARVDSLAVEFHGDDAARARLRQTIDGWGLGFQVREIPYWKVLHVVAPRAARGSPS